jgi:hypothetical protein
MNIDETYDDLFDEEGNLTPEAKVRAKAAALAGEEDIDQGLSVGAIEDMDSDTIIALSNAGQGLPVMPPKGFTGKSWQAFLAANRVGQKPQAGA